MHMCVLCGLGVAVGECVGCPVTVVDSCEQWLWSGGSGAVSISMNESCHTCE